MKKTFKIAGLKFDIDVSINKTKRVVLSEVADLILSHKKYGAIKHARDNFHISLKDVKIIMDGLAKPELSDDGDYHFVLTYQNKRDIVRYLMSSLGRYERKHID